MRCQFFSCNPVCFSVNTDRFKSDGREKSVDHKVDFLGQMGQPEVLQQSFFAAQTIDQHTEAQPTHRNTGL